MNEPLTGEPLTGGVYVHFPYCVHRCFYCDFNLVTPKVIPQEAYTRAILGELKRRAQRLREPARSLYFGGGTPSLWDKEWLAVVIEAVRQSPGLREDAEITLEANPVDISKDRCEGWMEAGINRLSLGVQSFDTKTLQAVDRRHTGEMAVSSIAVARSAGFNNLSVDLMFGLPGQSERAWHGELEQLLALSPPHVSVYGLTVEEKTQLHGLVKRGQVVLPDDALSHRMFFLTRDLLQSHGYCHYEVSAYAQPDQQAVHNSGYWAWRPYLGLGAGAHGFDGIRRWENIRRVNTYIDRAGVGQDPTAREEELDLEESSFERLMVGLRRLDEGIALEGDCSRFRPKAEELIARGWLEEFSGNVRVTREGLRWMNDVLSEFL